MCGGCVVPVQVVVPTEGAVFEHVLRVLARSCMRLCLTSADCLSVELVLCVYIHVNTVVGFSM
jgi:hypothetical protein